MQEGLKRPHSKTHIVKMVEQKLLKFLLGEHRGWELSGTGTPTQTPLFHLYLQIRDRFETHG